MRASGALRRLRPLLQQGHVQAAGISGPPKTLSEFEADAKKLTVQPDGSIKVAGFMPLATSTRLHDLLQRGLHRREWYDADGKSAFATDPAWAQPLMKWEKAFIENVYGRRLRQASEFFAAGRRPELGVVHRARLRDGQIAMAFDGEWRNAFIEDDKCQRELRHGPVPGRRRPPGALRRGADRRRRHRHPDERAARRRGMAAREVPGDRHASRGEARRDA